MGSYRGVYCDEDNAQGIDVNSWYEATDASQAYTSKGKTKS